MEKIKSAALAVWDWLVIVYGLLVGLIAVSPQPTLWLIVVLIVMLVL